MHDPNTVAFEVRYPWRAYPNAKTPWEKDYRASFITIWHRDPQRDGSDDSCGWFMRCRHGDQSVLEKIKADFAFNWDPDYGGWFDKEGNPLFSTMAIVLDMFRIAAFKHFDGRGAADRFIQKHLAHILHFAENPVDSMHSSITGKYGIERRQDRIDRAASIIYGCVLRWTRPAWKHPRWHFWHWNFQIHPWQNLRRHLFTRCCKCGGRFAYGESPCSSSWDSAPLRFMRGEQGLYHSSCGSIAVQPTDASGEGA